MHRAVSTGRQFGSGIVFLATLFAVGVIVTATIWIATGMGYFWPMWVGFGLWLPVAVLAAVRWRRGALAIQGSVSIVLGAALVLIWAMTGDRYFWPVFPLLGLGVAYVVGAMIYAPDPRKLAVRVDELTRTRRGALDVQAAELRRIERDLHDGAQSRLVSLSMQLGRAEERLADQPETAAMIRGAREEATAAIAELRDLARGIAPPVLADRGLVAAVQAVAERSGAPVTVTSNVEQRPPPVVETAAYFVVAETLTNAAKHAPDAAVEVTLTQTPAAVMVEVSDDGPGGADPAGSGLVGLRQRVEALDGTLTVASRPGDGTIVRAVFPCES
jgi:signal transduction histidine kinase